MNEERLNLLLGYLSELIELRKTEFTCVNEINECLSMIQLEFTKVEPLKEIGFKSIAGVTYKAHTKDGVFKKAVRDE